MYKLEKISGNIVDIPGRSVYSGTIHISDRKISAIVRDSSSYDTFIIPGFIDAHVHIESSMLVPSEFARLAVIHGTVAAVSDPHEIANVLGTEGVYYMMGNAEKTPFKFCFGAPSCVPATGFETSGGVLGAENVEELLDRDDIRYLSEVMNFPGVISNDPLLMTKINSAKKRNKRIDGHAPGLRGDALKKYIDSGITTDHEVLSYEEAVEKICLGMKILIREGSAARSLDELIELVRHYPKQCMFCSDDKHPDDLVRGHINLHVRTALDRGCDIFDVLMCASMNPAIHYGMDVGLLNPGDYADFLVIDNLSKDFRVLKTCINGEVVSEEGRCLAGRIEGGIINRFGALKKSPEDFQVRRSGNRINVIEVTDGHLTTGWAEETPAEKDGFVVSDIRRDILKLSVINRYADSRPAVAFVRNFGLKQGAIASSVAHDSHNIITVGVNDADIARAVNLIIEHKGGLSVVSNRGEEIFPLPVAGLMTGEDGCRAAAGYAAINRLAKELGSGLTSPFMTLSFMALLVIPSLKLSDRGLFDSGHFEFISLFKGQD